MHIYNKHRQRNSFAYFAGKLCNNHHLFLMPRLLCNLNSQEPVCMFYFAHPFGGIATPASTSYSIDPYAGMPTAEQISNSRPKNSSSNQANQQHLNDFTPWPRQTLQPRDVLSPLIQALQKQIGKLQILPFKKKKNFKYLK